MFQKKHGVDKIYAKQVVVVSQISNDLISSHST